MVHTNPEFEKLRIWFYDMEFYQHLGSLKHVINIIMWFRDMGCYSCLLRTPVSRPRCLPWRRLPRRHRRLPQRRRRPSRSITAPPSSYAGEPPSMPPSSSPSPKPEHHRATFFVRRWAALDAPSTLLPPPSTPPSPKLEHRRASSPRCGCAQVLVVGALPHATFFVHRLAQCLISSCSCLISSCSSLIMSCSCMISSFSCLIMSSQ
jgi:hypothetical protein